MTLDNNMQLSELQQRFCQEYLVDLDGTAAMTRAGILHGNVDNVLARPQVQAEIQRLQDERAIRTQVTSDRVLQELAHVAFAQVPDVVGFRKGKMYIKDFDQLTSDQKAAIAKVSERPSKTGGEREIEFHDKLKALDMVARHLNMYAADQNAGSSKVALMIGLRPDNGDDVKQPVAQQDE